MLTVKRDPSPLGAVIRRNRLPSTKNVTLAIREPRTVAVNGPFTQPLGPRNRAVPLTISGSGNTACAFNVVGKSSVSVTVLPRKSFPDTLAVLTNVPAGCPVV